MDEPQLRRWLVELLLALHYMQGKQVLHRDLKSSNLFLTSENDVQARGTSWAALLISCLATDASPDMRVPVHIVTLW